MLFLDTTQENKSIPYFNFLNHSHQYFHTCRCQSEHSGYLRWPSRLLPVPKHSAVCLVSDTLKTNVAKDKLRFFPQMCSQILDIFDICCWDCCHPFIINHQVTCVYVSQKCVPQQLFDYTTKALVTLKKPITNMNVK